MKKMMWWSPAALAWLWIGCAADGKPDGTNSGSADSSELSDGDESGSLTQDISPEIGDAVDPGDDPDVAYALVGGKAKVTASGGLHMRTQPSATAPIILTLPHNAIVNVLASQSGWYKVSYSSHTGWAYGAYLAPSDAPPTTTPVDRAIARAKSGVGFSYHWGGGCWSPGSGHPGACYGSCPNCTHAGTWGADCSGYVAKVWQVPGASALTTCSHPYSTYNFRWTTAHWSRVSRSHAKRGDAFVYDSGGEGHIFLFDSGDPWGWMHAYEAKGCSYGIVHDLRTAGSAYVVIRRSGY
jgi:cell wall-associated NlpC family hydrolase